VEALKNMIVGFVGLMAERASVVESRFAGVEAGAARELFPAEFVEKLLGAVEFRINAREGVPIDGGPGVMRPLETVAEISAQRRQKKFVGDGRGNIASDSAVVDLEEGKRDRIEGDIRLCGGEFVEFVCGQGVSLDVQLRG
jgi:hypothetical protein